MTNDNCRKFKQNQMMFCIQLCFVEFSIPIGVGEDRLRERGSSVSYTHLSWMVPGAAAAYPSVMDNPTLNASTDTGRQAIASSQSVNHQVR